jgi:WD40 repeat protein
MTSLPFSEDIPDDSIQSSLEELAWAIEESTGKFSLILAHCNSADLRERWVQRLQQLCSVELPYIVLDRSVNTLYTTIQAVLDGEEHPQALMVCGLESVSALDRVLTGANQIREEFRKNFHFPLVLWVTDGILQKLIRLAPDFYSWATTVEFVLPNNELIRIIQQTADWVFAKLLDTSVTIFLDNATVNREIDAARCNELESARQELQNRGVSLDLQIEASLEFVLGRNAEASMEQSLQHYERSLAFWQQQESQLIGTSLEENLPDKQTTVRQNLSSSNPKAKIQDPNLLERQGCVLYCLGIWWFGYAERQRAERERTCQRAKAYFLQCIEVLERANREDLVAKFINALGTVLQQLEQWDELEAIAKKALALHQTYLEPFRLARSYSFLAEVALAQSAWIEARQFAQQALSILENALIAVSTPVSDEQSAIVEWERSFHQGWYLFALARAQQGLGNVEESLKNLETALHQAKSQYDPDLYIRILRQLRDGYFDRGQYLEAYRYKQERRSIEQQFGFRAFVGAGRLRPSRQVANPAITFGESQRSIAREITASGRQQDVNRLVERIGRIDRKLTVIYGQSGVGKSSIVQAGLIPALRHQAIGTRDVLPILQRVYIDWVRELGLALAKELEASRGNCLMSVTLDSTATLLEQLSTNADNNLLTVLVFDQFEEFFFVCKELQQRLIFYEFLRECLEIPYVKIILSLREDYLHYLLHCNRLVNLEAIDNNILDKNILYYLGNFSPEDTKSVVQSLTEPTQFSLESSLIDELVQDLAGELGEVRPIELQVVGAQLQTENIRTLEEYRKYGPKGKLVQRYLEEVVKDCGRENQRAAELVLYLLTDENDTRPLKTRAELEIALKALADDLAAEANKLDLVLRIFVESGLVVLLPELPADRYQLVHDYLVTFIRRQQEPKINELITQLEQEREQRQKAEEQHKQTEAELERAGKAIQMLEANVQQARKDLAFLAAERYRINREVKKAQEKLKETEAAREEAIAATQLEQAGLSALQQFDFSQIDALLAAMRLVQQLQVRVKEDRPFTQYPAHSPLLALQQILDRIQEKNRFQGHEKSIFSVSFSSDGQYLATASEDSTARLWDLQGNQLVVFQGHQGRIMSISFSPNRQYLATASEDSTARLWDLQGNQLVVFQGHQHGVNGVSFSPDGQYLATASGDNTARLWDLQGNQLIEFQSHENWVRSISFSPAGQYVATASGDYTARLWDLQGNQLVKFIGHHWEVTSVSFSPNGQYLATGSLDGTARLWNLQGNQLKTFRGHRGRVRSVSFSPDGQYLATGSDEGIARLWDLQGNQLDEFKGHEARVNSVSFSPDGQCLATASGDCTVRLWNLHGKQLVTFQGHQRGVTSLSFSPDGEYLVTASSDGTAKLWNLQGNQLSEFKGHAGWVRSVSFSPDGQYIATASSDGTTILWDLLGNQVAKFKGHRGGIRSVSFSPDGQYLATASDDGTTARVWDWQGNQVVELRGHISGVLSVSFSPDGHYLATTSYDETAKLWNLQGEQLTEFKGHTSLVCSVSFSPDGQYLVTTSFDRTAKLWDWQGNQLSEFKGHASWVTSASFSPDGEYLATASDDGTIRLWDLRGNQLNAFQGHNNSVHNVSFSPDGQYLATASADGTAKLWRVEKNLNELLVKGCNWLRDYLTTNQNVCESDRTLCDDISIQK